MSSNGGRQKCAILKHMKVTLAIFFYLALTLANPGILSANTEFTTNFSSEYTIEKSGLTSVRHQVAITNNLSHIYATTYTIATSGENLEHISVRDETGVLSTTINSQNGFTNIQTVIPNPAIGKDQTKTLVISYQTNDIVERLGETISINLPRLAKANEAQSYKRIVRVSGADDLPSLIYPPQSKADRDGEYLVYTFDGHQNDSVTLLFGESVTYHLNLTYELRNKELRNVDSELALPPDTPYQHVLLHKLEPKPLHIRLDSDGNWLARYNLKSQESMLIEAELFITVYPQPELYDPSETKFIKTPHAKYWDTTSSTVLGLAEQLKTPKNIYDYITANFTYNYAQSTIGSPRKGAHDSLISPTNVLCTEYTDSFVSLARTLEIPAREINGYGFTNNSRLQPQLESSDILHAWPEYYSSTHSKWISVDPTWGHTTGGIDYFNKLDFNHITFIRRGREDTYPLPAGSYKSNSTHKHVFVEVASYVPEKVLRYDITENGSKTTLTNTGNVALLKETIKLPDQDYVVEYLPPYATYEIPASHSISLYDKIKAICVAFLSKFLQLLPASS